MPTHAANPAATLNHDEILRYSRHLILPEVGMEGQLKLKHARVLCIGAGGLGSPVALYLAAAGVGTLGIVDFDIVDLTNLQRQIIHSTNDVGRSKLDSAAETIAAINPNIDVRKFETRLTSANALEIVRDFDLVVDGTDNFTTRYLVNDACVLTRQAERLRLYLPLRRTGQRLRHQRRPVLSLPVSRAAAAGRRALLRRGRCAGNSARTGRHDSGDRSDQAHPRLRRIARRAAVDDRRPQHALPRTESPQECRLPGLRRSSHRDRTDRLRAILRRAWCGNAVNCYYART